MSAMFTDRNYFSSLLIQLKSLPPPLESSSLTNSLHLVLDSANTRSIKYFLCFWATAIVLLMLCVWSPRSVWGSIGCCWARLKVTVRSARFSSDGSFLKLISGE